MAGKGSLRYDHPLNLGAVGATGTLAANRLARDADLVIGIGTRYSDFTTASKTAFQAPGVRFININVAEFDAAKHAGAGPGRRRPGDAGGAGRACWPATRSTPHTGAGAERCTTSGTREVERIYAMRHDAAAQPGRADRRGQRARRPGGDHGLRGRQPARRPAQAVARAPPEAVPPGVRLLLHGLRDRRRAWASRWPRPSARSTSWSATAAT